MGLSCLSHHMGSPYWLVDGDIHSSLAVDGEPFPKHVYMSLLVFCVVLCDSCCLF